MRSKLWLYTKRTVNPGTAVGAKELKDEVESKKMVEFGHDISKYNQYLKETRAVIIQDKGAGLYNEFARYVFKTYHTCNNVEFIKMVKLEKRRCMMDQLPDGYCHLDLTTFGLMTFNNISGNKDGDESKITTPTTEAESKRITKNEEEVRILDLFTETAKKAFESQSNSGHNHNSNGG